MKHTAKKIAALALCVLLCMAFTACSAPASDIVTPDADKLFYGELVYNTVLTDNNGAQTTYPTIYTIERKNDEIIISSSGELKEQSMQSCSILYANGTNGKTSDETPIPRAFMPKKITMNFKNTEKPKANVDINAEHSLENQEIKLAVSQFENENDSEPKTKNYTIPTSSQYYDSDSLLWMISTLPLEVGYSVNLTISSSNRDQLQSMNISVKEELKYIINKDSETQKEFDCYVVIIKPNTPFTNFATYVYYAKDYHNMIVAIKQETTSFELTSFTEKSE